MFSLLTLNKSMAAGHDLMISDSCVVTDLIALHESHMPPLLLHLAKILLVEEYRHLGWKRVQERAMIG